MDYWSKRKTESIKLDSVKFSWLGIEGTWVADKDQQKAAWELYVELITRVSVQPLAADEGLLREALTSLYSLFGETRRILKSYGPGVATSLKKNALSFGEIAVTVLNRGLRPILSKWHPLLLAHENVRLKEVSQTEHERT